MAIFTETIGTDLTPFEVYGGLTACTHYLLASGDDGAVAFRAAAADDQKRALVGATRYIDGFFWSGVATGLAGGTPTTLQFPRSGLTDAYGAALDATNVPSQVVSAAFEMAAILVVDPTAASNADQGSNVASLGAGPASLSFFRPTSAQLGTASVMPTVVDRLIGRWLASSQAAVAGFISGTNPCSDFSMCTSCGCSMSTCCCSAGRRDVTWPV